MVVMSLTTYSINDIYRFIVNPDGDVEDSDRIEIASEFQRGGDENGVWSRSGGQLYINSVEKNFPTGMLSTVKTSASHARSLKLSLAYSILDGGNRTRAIRDFRANKWPLEDGTFHHPEDGKTKFMDEARRAKFNSIQLPVQAIKLQSTDPRGTIAEMFTRLNTTATKLSQGELIRAYGWLQDKQIIEMAKLFVGDTWTTNYNNVDVVILADRWNAVFGGVVGKPRKLKEGKRSDSLAMMCAFFVSAHTGNPSLFDKNYEKLSPHLDTELSEDNVDGIIGKVNKFLDIMEVVYSPVVFTTITHGIPSKKSINVIWAKVCEGKLTPQFEGKLKEFYKALAENNDLFREYQDIQNSGGDGHSTARKISDVLSMINKWTFRLD